MIGTELLLERLKILERRLAALEQGEYTRGGGDMTKAAYDPNADGRVSLAVDSDTVDGQHAAAFALAAQGVTNGDSHDHVGGDGGQIDHGGLAGLVDDDHSQYYNDARHIAAVHNAMGLDHGVLGGLADDDHSQYYNSTRHTAALHNALGLDHGNLAGLGDDDHPQYKQITASARYKVASAKSLASGSTVILDFDTEDFDTDSAVVTGASWKFTVPTGKGGYYLVTACCLIDASTAWGVGEMAVLHLYKNNAEATNFHVLHAQAAAGTAFAMMLIGTTIIQLAAGDYIDVRAFQNSGSTLATNPSGLNTHVAIARLF